MTDIDPNDYESVTSFKSAYYDQHGAGSWLADAKLKVIWLHAHDKNVPDHLQPLLKDD